MSEANFLEIGKITSAHGIRGEVKVIPLTDDPKRYDDLAWVYLDRNGVMEKRTIEKVRYFKSQVIVKLKDVNCRNSAEELKGMYLKVDREHAVKLPADSYFICDLIGCAVYTDGGAKIGELADVLKTGGNDVFIVRKDDGKEILIPALKSVVREISLEDRKIMVVLPEGLVDNEV